jgi:hypothetical protein
MRAPTRALALLLLAGACRGGSLPRPSELEATVEALTLEETGTGRLRVLVAAPGPPVARLRWELALDGRRFATGLETALPAVEGGLRLDVPLAWRHVGWREGPRFLLVEVRGDVLSAGEATGLPFQAARELLVPGAPVLEAPLE